jgi:AraC-like DNA-binding protein
MGDAASWGRRAVSELVTAHLKGAGIALSLLLSIVFARPGATIGIRLWGGLFSLSIVAYIAGSSPLLLSALGPFKAVQWALGAVSPALLVLFGRALLTDVRHVDRAGVIVLIGFSVLALTAANVPLPISKRLWQVHQLLEFGVFFYLAYLAFAGWREDLVEQRRQLRGPLIASITALGFVLGGFETWGFFAPVPEQFRLIEGLAIAVLSFAIAAVVLRLEWPEFALEAPRPVGVPETPANAEPERASVGDDFSPADRLELQRILVVVDEEGAWRDETLSVGALAQRVGIPEHRLRRLINRGLGHRNFSAFLNERRLAEAKRRLSDPNEARTPILTIALSVGFASIAPFNRAFREATGQTPSDWRRDNLDAGAQG